MQNTASVSLFIEYCGVFAPWMPYLPFQVVVELVSWMLFTDVHCAASPTANIVVVIPTANTNQNQQQTHRAARATPTPKPAHSCSRSASLHKTIQRNENTKGESGFRVVVEILRSGIGVRNTWTACEPIGYMRAHAVEILLILI